MQLGTHLNLYYSVVILEFDIISSEEAVGSPNGALSKLGPAKFSL